jgi:hypothetical protein
MKTDDKRGTLLNQEFASGRGKPEHGNTNVWFTKMEPPHTRERSSMITSSRNSISALSPSSNEPKPLSMTPRFERMQGR